jgi:hypothetical protein
LCVDDVAGSILRVNGRPVYQPKNSAPLKPRNSPLSKRNTQLKLLKRKPVCIYLSIHPSIHPSIYFTANSNGKAMTSKRVPSFFCCRVIIAGLPIPPPPAALKPKKVHHHKKVTAAKAKRGGKHAKKAKKPKAPVKPTKYTRNRKFFRQLLKECRKLKRYTCGVYTTKSDWAAIMGKRPMKVLRGKTKKGKKIHTPLWYPNVEEVPTASTDNFEAFGGWKKPFFKQYSQKQNVWYV